MASKAILRVRQVSVPAIQDASAHEAEIIGKSRDPNFHLTADTRRSIGNGIQNTINTLLIQRVQGLQVIEEVAANACVVELTADFVIEFVTSSLVDTIYTIITRSGEWQHTFPTESVSNGQTTPGGLADDRIFWMLGFALVVVVVVCLLVRYI